MKEGRSSSRMEAQLEELRRSVQGYEPNTDAQDALYVEALAEVGELEENREFRLLAVDEGIPYMVWVVLIVGGVLTVGFTYLFGMESVRLHAVAVAGLTILISLILQRSTSWTIPLTAGCGWNRTRSSTSCARSEVMVDHEPGATNRTQRVVPGLYVAADEDQPRPGMACLAELLRRSCTAHL